ncbi:MAG: hypothetical protein ACRDL6_00430 [Solirubrobacterales bacterium]
MRRLRAIENSAELGSGSSEWRRHRLLRAGVPPELAETVAHDRRFDVHALLELLDRGCRPELAVRIVAPLDEAGE